MKIKIKNQSTGQVTHVDENTRTAAGNKPAAASPSLGQHVNIGGRGVKVNTITPEELQRRMQAPSQQSRSTVLTEAQKQEQRRAALQTKLDKNKYAGAYSENAKPTKEQYIQVRDNARRTATETQAKLDAMQKAWNNTAPQTGNTDAYYNPESASAKRMNEMIQERRTMEAVIAQQNTLAQNANDMVTVDEITERGDADLFNRLYVEMNAQTALGMSSEERKREAENYDAAEKALLAKGYSAAKIKEYLASFTRWNDQENAEGLRGAIDEIAKTLPITATATSVALGLATAVPAAVGSMVLQSGRPNSPYQAFNVISQQTRETVGNKAAEEAKSVATALGVSEKAAEHIGKGAQWAYQAGASMLESAIAMGTGNVLGEVLLGLNAATQTYNENLTSGMDNGKALAGAVAAGIFEYTFEHVSLENLRALQASGKKGFFNAVADIVKQFTTEGSEEIATDIANELYDYMINGGYSKYSQTVADVIANGGTEADAKSQYAKDLMSQLLESGVVGGLAGAMGGGRIRGQQAVNRANMNVQTGRAVQNEAAKTEGGVKATLAPLTESLKGTKAGEALSRVDGKTGAYKTGKAVVNAVEAYQAQHKEKATQTNIDTITDILTEENGPKLDKEIARDVANAYVEFMTEDEPSDKTLTTLLAHDKAVDAINDAISNGTYSAVKDLQKKIIETAQANRLSTKLLEKVQKWVDKEQIERAQRHGDVLNNTEVAIKNGESEKLVTEKAKIRYEGGRGEAQGIKGVDENGNVQIVVDESGATANLADVKFADTYEGYRARDAYKIAADMIAGRGEYTQKVSVEGANLMLGLALTSEAPVDRYLKDAYDAYTAGAVLRNRNTFMMDVEGGYSYLSLKDLNTLYDQGRTKYQFKPGVVRIGTRRMTEAQQKEAMLLDRYFMDKGLTLVITDRLYDKDAAMLYGEANKNVIVVALASPRDNLIQLTVGHELFHWTKMQGGAVAKEAQKLETALNDALKKAKPEQYKAINDDLIKAGYTDEEIRREEIACQYFGTLWTLNTYAEQVAKDNERASVWKKMLDHVKDFLGGVKERIKVAFGHDKTVMEALNASTDEVAAVARRFDELIRKAAAQRQKTEGPSEQESETKQSRSKEGEITEEQAEKLEKKQDLTIAEQSQYSRAIDQKMMNAAFGANSTINYGIMMRAAQARSAVKQALQDAEYDKNGNRKLMLPEDIAGKGWVKNGSYGRTVEPTTVCPRSVGYDRLSEMIAKQIGRPLNMEESLAVAQNIGLLTNEIQCLYCYVAADRIAYSEAINKFISDRDVALKLLNAGKISTWQEFHQAYLEQSPGRKGTKVTEKLAKYYVDGYNKDKAFVQPEDVYDLTNENTRLDEVRKRLQENNKLEEFDYLRNYAQNATWAKKRINYMAYDGDILKWKQEDINKLNKQFGLRFYSFSDYSAAFILDNMQAITDASVRGLKGLAYSKSTDFARIFAPSGININMSVFGNMVNGEMQEDDMQGANWDEVKKLRDQYDNVGAVFVAMNDDGVKWALDQDWIDVVIPYHTVRAGEKITEFYGWTDNKGYQEDRKTKEWKKGTDLKSIPPHLHNNDKDTYMRMLEDNHLTARFEKWTWHNNYMKLVKETRRSAGDTPAMQPVFDLDEALAAIKRMEESGSYLEPLGGSNEAMQAFADMMVEEIRTTDEADLRDLELDSAAFAKRMSELKEAAESETRQSRVLDQEYMSAVETGDEAKQAALVEQAAKAAGYNSQKLYHGTDEFGFTRIDVGESDDYISFFATDNKNTASSYSFADDVTTIESKKQTSKNLDTAWQKVENAIQDLIKKGNALTDNNDINKDQVLTLLRETLGGTSNKEIGTKLEQLVMFNLPDKFDYFNRIEEIEDYRMKVSAAVNAWEDYGKYIDENRNLIRGGGMYQLYANTDGFLVVDGKGRNWHNIDFQNEIKTTRSIAKYAFDNGYKGVKFLNIVDYGEHYESSKIETADVYVFFDPQAQVKSADPVVYDDKGKVIPLSERFNAEKTDIRYSRVLNQNAVDYVNRLKAGSRELWEMIDILEDRAAEMAGVREYTGQAPLDRKDLERIARRYNRAADKSKVHIGAMALRLEKAQELLATSMNVDTVLYGLYKIAEEEWQYAGRWENAASDVADFKKELRHNGRPRKVYLSESDYETLAAGRGGRKRFRDEYFNKIDFTTDKAYIGQGLDVLYDELKETGKYGLPDVTTPSEQWEAILRLYRAGNDKVLVDTAEKMGIVGDTLTERATTDAFNMLRDLLYDYDKIKDVKKRVADGRPMSEAQWAILDEAERLDKLQEAVEDERHRGVQSIITQADEELQKRLEQISKSGKSTVDAEVERERIKNEYRLQTARAIYDERVKRIEQHYRDIAEKEALRADIRRNLNAMVKLFTKESDSAHVPQSLKGIVLQFMRMFDKDRTLISAANMHNLTEFSAALDDDANEQADEEYQELFGRFDEDIRKDLKDLENRITTMESKGENGRQVRRRVYTSMLSLDEMRVLSNTMEHIRFLIESANEAFVDGKRRKISVLGDRLMNDAKAVTSESKLKNAVRNTLANDFVATKMLTPIYFFEEKVGSSMKEVYEGFRNAQDEWYRRTAKGKYIIQKAKTDYKYNEWKDKTIHFSFPEALRRSAWDVDLPVEAIMQLYVTLKREQSTGKDSTHLSEGGIVLGEEISAGNDLKSKLKGLTEKGLKGFVEQAVQDADKQAKATRHMLSYDELLSIVNHPEFTQQMKDYADTIVKFMSTDVSVWGNGASMQLAGIKKFNEKYYFPFVSAKDYLYTRLGVSDDTRLKNAGFTKKLQWGAKNPLVIEGFTDVAANHIQQMALYSTMTVPIDTLQRLINYAPVVIDEEGHQHLDDEDNVKTAIKNAYGKGAMTYINNFVTQVNGGIRPDPLDNLWNKGTSMFKRAAVMGNASVVVQQPTALMRAMAVINPKYFFGKPNKEDFKDMMEHAPVAGIKVMGGFDTMTGRGAAEWMVDEQTKAEKLTEAFGKGAEWADNVTWTNIWNACKRETRAMHTDVEYGSDEFYDIAYKRFRDVVDYTQVYDSTLSKNELMRGKGALTTMVTAFMAEPSLSFNLITQSGKGRTIHKGRALGAFAANIIVNSMFRAIVAGWRDKDDDETYLEKWLEHFVSDLAGDKNVAFLDGAWSPFAMLPWVKDLISLWDGYSVDRADVSAISDLFDSMKAAKKAFDNYDGTAKSVDFEALVEFAGAISNLTPAPLSKILQDIFGIEQTFANMAQNPMETTWQTAAQAVVEGLGYDVKRAEKAYEAAVNNNVEYIRRATEPDNEKIKGYIADGYADQEARTRAKNDAMRSWYETVADGIIQKDERIQQAAQARYDLKLNTYETLVQEMIEDGLPEYSVLKAIEKLYAEKTPADVDLKEIKEKSLYKTDDLDKAIDNNDVSAFNRIKEELMIDGTSEDTIIKHAENKAKAYFNETDDAAGAKSILKNFADYSESKADSKVGYWKHQATATDAMSASQWTTYYDKVASTGISTDVYMSYVNRAAACKGEDKNGDGKPDSGTKKKEILKVIDSLPITKAQKDALYRLNDWAESTLNEAPWNK